MTRFALEPIYGSIWVAILAAAVVVAIISFVTPPTEDPRRRRWLIGLRCVAALVLLLSAMRPSLIRTDNRPAEATLVIAVDSSKSMTLPDGDGSDRWARQSRSLQQLLAGLRGLDESLDVELIAYDARSESLAAASEPEQLDGLARAAEQRLPDGRATDLGRAMQGAIDVARGRPIAGVVLLGDGTQTARAPISSASVSAVNQVTANDPAAARRGAEVLDALGVPLWTVPIGPPPSDGSARDVEVSDLPDSFRLFAGNQFDVAFTVRSSGLAGTTIPVTVSWVAEDGTRTEARSRQIDSGAAAKETTSMSIPMTAPEPGLYRLQVSAAKQDGEWVTSNNSQTAFVEVREGGGRILVLEGPGRPEQTFLRRSLRRFPDLEIRYASIRGNQTWPVSLEAVLERGRFDVFVLGDLDAAALGEKQLEMLADRIGEGAGLITLGGYQAYGTGGYGDTPLAKVLPVQMDASRRRASVRGVLTPAELQARQASQLAGPITVLPAKSHPIVDLGGSQLDEPWKTLPSLPGANRFKGTKIAAGVQVLLETPDKDPLLVVGGYGKGRVASLALDETYRWWRSGQAELHRRFWRQLMLWLMSREDSGGDQVILEMDSRRFETDAQPSFEARVQSLVDPVSPIILTATVLDENGQEQVLEVTSQSGEGVGGTSLIRGSLPTLEPGFYRLRANAENASNIQPDEVAFQVIQTSRELSRPMADPVYLQQLAELTSAHGGASFAPDRMDDLIDVIGQKRRRAETPVIEKQRLGDGPLSGWIVFALFTSALSVEWFLRRRWGV